MGRRNGGGVAEHKKDKGDWKKFNRELDASNLRAMLKRMPRNEVLNAISEWASMNDIDELQSRLP